MWKATRWPVITGGLFITTSPPLKVTAGSGAERSGLCEDDVVVEVNGQSVEKEYLKEVVRLIMCGGSSVKMVVMDRHGYKTQRQSGLPYTAVVPCNNRVRT